MKRIFPLIAFAIGLIISISLLMMNPLATEATHKIPLLTALLMSEFGFLVNAAAAGMIIYGFFSEGLNKLNVIVLPANIIFALYLLQTGFKLWPGVAAI